MKIPRSLNLLVLDTAGEGLSLALKAGEKVVSGRRSCRLGQDQVLIPSVEKILAKAGLRLEDLDAVAAASGPGRFTGIRIGMAYAAVLASRLKIPALAVSRLEAVAFKSPEKRLCAVLPGFRDEKFHQLFLRSGNAPRPAGAPSWLRRPDWEKTRAVLEKEGWAFSEPALQAIDLIAPALSQLSLSRQPTFEPLYLKPAGYETKSVR